MEKETVFVFLCIFLGTCGVVFNKGIGGFVFYFHILGFQFFIKWESTFNILNISSYYFCHLTNFFFKYIIFSHKSFLHRLLLKSLIVNYHRCSKVKFNLISFNLISNNVKGLQS